MLLVSDQNLSRITSTEIGVADFKFVTTDGEERIPTPENSTPLEEGDDEGRGSLVYFNQASMYQSSELNCPTLKEAIAEGHHGTVDYRTSIQNALQDLGMLCTLNAPE